MQEKECKEGGVIEHKLTKSRNELNRNKIKPCFFLSLSLLHAYRPVHGLCSYKNKTIFLTAFIVKIRSCVILKDRHCCTLAKINKQSYTSTKSKEFNDPDKISHPDFHFIDFN